MTLLAAALLATAVLLTWRAITGEPVPVWGDMTRAVMVVLWMGFAVSGAKDGLQRFIARELRRIESDRLLGLLTVDGRPTLRRAK